MYVVNFVCIVGGGGRKACRSSRRGRTRKTHIHTQTHKERKKRRDTYRKSTQSWHELLGPGSLAHACLPCFIRQRRTDVEDQHSNQPPPSSSSTPPSRGQCGKVSARGTVHSADVLVSAERDQEKKKNQCLAPQGPRSEVSMLSIIINRPRAVNPSLAFPREIFSFLLQASLSTAGPPLVRPALSQNQK